MNQDGVDRVLGVSWAFTSVGLMMTAARVYTRARIVRQFGLEDYLIVAAMVLGIVLLVTTHSIAIACYRFYQIIDPTVERSEFPQEWWDAEELIFRWVYVNVIVYFIEHCLIKLSMLVFYRRFLTKKPYTTILYAFMAFVIMSTIATVIPSIFHCKPIEAAWVLNLPGSTCPVYAQKLHVGSGVINLVTDVILIALPIPIVVHLKTSTRKKWGLTALFSLGCVVSFATAYRLAEIVGWPHSQTANNLVKWYAKHEAFHLWTQIEINLGLICANLPSLAALGRAMRKRHQTGNGYSDPYSGNKAHYELSGNAPRSNKSNKKPVPSNDVVVGRNTSEEQMVPKDSDIVRSTNVQVNYERA